MEVRAEATNLGISPQKLRLVIDQVRGLAAEQAITVLEFMPKKGAKLATKVLKSAIANAENNFELERANLFITRIYANEGPRLKRFKAGARGRYKPRVKRTSHLIVVLGEREEE
ncbi:MAG: 50S ribosomal protein L22 [Burkholderiales bacterium]|nr:50S ribosomal protein L22 [Anaerolineae bacterium]